MRRNMASFLVLIASAIACVLAYPHYAEYVGERAAVEENDRLIDETRGRIRDAESSFALVKGDAAPRDLQEIVGFISQYEDVEIVSMTSFMLNGDGIETLGSVTSASDKSLCDGYELTLTSGNLAGFIQYLDGGGLTYHSADFQLGAKTAVLRLLVGGRLDG